MLELDQIAGLVAKPITDSEPAGANCQDDDKYISLRNEMQKLSRAGQSSGIEWNTVSNNSLFLLIEKSKDFQVACYLAYALFHQYQYPGLKVGANVLTNMLERYWDSSHPQDRPRVKVNFLNWYASQCFNYIQYIKPVDNVKDIQQSVKYFNKIRDFLSERELEFESFNNLIATLNEYLRQLDFKMVEPQKEEKPVKLEDSVKTIQQDESLPLEQGFLTLTRGARDLMKADLTLPYPYYLNRLAAWGSIAVLPDVEDGVTSISPPDFFSVKRINTIQDGNDPLEVLRLVEEIIPDEPFWLDLQILSLDMLKKLGERYEEAFAVVKREFIQFLQRFPGIEKLKFNNNSAFLSDWAQDQLNELRTTSSMSFTDRMSHLSSAEQQQIDDIKTLCKAFSRKNIELEIVQLEQINKQAVSERVRLTAYMAICEELLKAGNRTIIRPYLLFILEIIDKHQLGTWDSVLTLDALSLVYRGMKTIRNKISDDLFEQVIDRVARIDSKMVLELSKL
ncbi:TssA family type VI secretion system protein [Legionella sp. 16cNR16C]|uniref:TssA family type VI secretion system protein n=1 Tax=Legionella sp. 16cNR16C TaxID=2905656 RepID=UPI001E354CE6|nr:TssA family type VI secretion system protein [Legionella sp. 16cNR16C]MCE3045911.1 TssA family type VI secretion system protein [Legionella sp. 16cNR16C]